VNSRTIALGILRAIFILAGILLLGYFLYLIRSVITYIIVAAVVALVGRPIVIFLRKRLKFPNTLAVVVVIVLLLGILVGIISMFIPLIAEQGHNLSLLDIDSFEANLTRLYHEIRNYLAGTPFEVGAIMDDAKLQMDLIKDLEMNFIPDFLNSLMGVLSSLSIGLFSILFISFFFLKDSKLLQNALLTLVPDNLEPNLVHSTEKIKSLLSRYFVGLVIQIFVLFVVYTIALLLIGVQNALVIAFLCALFNLIPYIGPIIGGILMILLTMTSQLGADFRLEILPDVGWVLLALTIGQLIDNFISQPVIYSTSVRSHPLEIFLVILIAGLLFGVAGMIFAIPGYTALKVVLKEFLSDNKIVKHLTKDL
jgi:predicted PurR-regulated permease PerM